MENPIPPSRKTAKKSRSPVFSRAVRIWSVVAIVAVAIFLWWADRAKLPQRYRPAREANAVQPTVVRHRHAPRSRPEKESAKPQAPKETEPAPTLETHFSPHAARSVFEAQVVMAREGISPGSIDGVMGLQTQSALEAYQRKHSLRVTGELDEETRASMILSKPALTTYTVTRSDVLNLSDSEHTWIEKSELPTLGYTSILEMAAEKGRCSPDFLKSINPDIDWEHAGAGAQLTIPDAKCDQPPVKAAYALISLGAKTLEVYDDDGRLLLHFPCSIARRVEKRPVGTLHVAVIVRNPNYTFDPAVFKESPAAQAIGHKLLIAPGPNNPVGVAWIGLDLPGYGIHGTPEPEHVGRTESHGCFRLANWNASDLLDYVWVGMPVEVQP